MIAISSTSRIGVNMTPTSACRTHSFNFLPLMSGGNTPSIGLGKSSDSGKFLQKKSGPDFEDFLKNLPNSRCC